ncbi:uncharacterized protein [Macrobrachium rosenbergii]|uniref:uncharacterized protein n=1 Tax=Macrobrachium rosenbergii TaxID=79674 RepID=UPI0034D5D579
MQQTPHPEHFKRLCPPPKTGISVSHYLRYTQGFCTPSPSSATPDSNSLPVPLESTEQYQAPNISDVAPPLPLTSVPGPKLVPVPDQNHVTDPPTGDPPKLTELVIANCEPPTPDVSSSQSFSSAENETLANFNVTPSPVDQNCPAETQTLWKLHFSRPMTCARCCKQPMRRFTPTQTSEDSFPLKGPDPQTVMARFAFIPSLHKPVKDTDSESVKSGTTEYCSHEVTPSSATKRLNNAVNRKVDMSCSKDIQEYKVNTVVLTREHAHPPLQDAKVIQEVLQKDLWVH